MAFQSCNFPMLDSFLRNSWEHLCFCIPSKKERKLIKSKNDELLKIILLSVHMCEFITVVCPHFENYEAIFQSWWPKDSVAICLICIFLWVQVFLKNAKKAKQKVTILNNSPCVCI